MWTLILALLKRLPQGLLSRITGRLADVRLARPFRKPVVGAFVRFTGIDLSETGRDVQSFRSVSDCFTRRLLPGVRNWPDDESVPASPVDGVVAAHGTIRAGTLVQAKGIEYSVSELLARTDEPGSEEASRWEGGRFLTIYLSPRHYHRIHAPVSGTLKRAVAVPGRLLPVNPPAVASIPRLFATNERLVMEFETEAGEAAALVAVGAFNVGRIWASFDPSWNRGQSGVTNLSGSSSGPHPWSGDRLSVGRGEEVGIFELGSTVVVLLAGEAGNKVWAPRVRAATEIQLGDPLLSPPSSSQAPVLP